MVGAGNDQEREYVLGYSPDGRFEIVARPVRGPVRAYRPRSPPPPPPPQPPRRPPSPPQQQPQPPRLPITSFIASGGHRQLTDQSSASAASGPLPERPAPPQRPPTPARRPLWIPVSDGTYAKADGCTVVWNFTGKLTITRDENGARVVKQEPLDPGFEDRMAALEKSFTGVRPRKATPPPRPPPAKDCPTAR
uniref:WAS/WASL-interacting protein family member 3-like n=1 Tax=Crassostrea virginica TaxID=6565 RepID=A0A8B8C8L7_CRAVI|nr:WAS/WASL-interacting protein family member 3-like [Crassostrea virginica]